jgi:hypothetical protein
LAPARVKADADCDDRINLEFEIHSEAARANSLHKIDTLIATLRVFRIGVEQEFEHYDRRERELGRAPRHGAWPGTP